MHTDPAHRFDNFIVGAGNRLAVAAARAVAEAPGAVYNPLLIYSSSGLGKTHLVGAIGNLARQIGSRLNVEYLTLDEFVDQMHAAVAAARMDAFKERFSEVDLLILDDAQFLTGKRETQSELLRLLAAWQRSGKQLVLTSDRPPSEIADVDERLLTRLTGGLIVDIAAPDLETRLAILQAKCEERQLRFEAGVLDELASLEFSNVRELQGALNRLAVHQVAGNGNLQRGMVRQVLGLVVRSTPVQIPAGAMSSDVEFASFIEDVASVVAQQVQGWRIQLGEAIATWASKGYATVALERQLAAPADPDVAAVLRRFEMGVEELRELQRQANEMDPAAAGSALFRDVEAIEAAREHIQKLLAGYGTAPAPAAEFTRDSFAVGPSNELAVRVSDMVISQPGSKYNPLFIHGPGGVGRTHLLSAVGNELVNVSGGAIRVIMVGAQAFIDELVSSLQNGGIERFRARYRSADALIVDDVHFICGKERTQDEVFHLFNSYQSAGKQIVLSADRHPKDMDGLEERLRSRFEGGVVVGIAPPDRVVREKLFATHLGGIELNERERLLGYLAERPAESVREAIETAYRLRAAADAAGIPITVEFARTELDRVTPVRASRTTPSRTLDPFFLDDEKVLWRWPDAASRLIEDLR
jgi:chromosomal replication initiator protein DnaA